MSASFLPLVLFLSAVGLVPMHSEKTPTVEYLQGLGFVLSLEARADLPYEYGWNTWRAARAEGVDPVELATLLVTEKSGPDIDFSVEGFLRKSYTYSWDPDAEGALEERGLFQVAPTWAVKAGFQPSELWEPEVNARVAAFVLRSAHESHAKCEIRARARAQKTGLPYIMLHTHVAHWKCHKSARDSREGMCYDSQKKFQKTRASLVSSRSPSFRSIGAAYNDWYDGQVEKVADRMRHKANSVRRRSARARLRAIELQTASLAELAKTQSKQ